MLKQKKKMIKKNSNYFKVISALEQHAKTLYGVQVCKSLVVPLKIRLCCLKSVGRVLQQMLTFFLF